MSEEVKTGRQLDVVEFGTERCPLLKGLCDTYLVPVNTSNWSSRWAFLKYSSTVCVCVYETLFTYFAPGMPVPETTVQSSKIDKTRYENKSNLHCVLL